MKLEDQLCNLEQSKKLKELGIIQESVFYYTQFSTPTNPNLALYGWRQEHMPVEIYFRRQGGISGKDVFVEYSAFTVAELGVVLPSGYDTMYNTGLGWCGYDRDGEHFLQSFDTEAECRAAMLIEIIKRKEVTIEECNKRLTGK